MGYSLPGGWRGDYATPSKRAFLMEQTDNQKFIEAIQKLTFTEHLFKLKVKEEMYNDEQRLKSTVVRVDRID
jgi:replication factor A1